MTAIDTDIIDFRVRLGRDRARGLLTLCARNDVSPDMMLARLIDGAMDGLAAVPGSDPTSGLRMMGRILATEVAQAVDWNDLLGRFDRLGFTLDALVQPALGRDGDGGKAGPVISIVTRAGTALCTTDDLGLPSSDLARRFGLSVITGGRA